MQLVLPMCNAHAYFSLKNLGKKCITYSKIKYAPIWKLFMSNTSIYNVKNGFYIHHFILASYPMRNRGNRDYLPHFISISPLRFQPCFLTHGPSLLQPKNFLYVLCNLGKARISFSFSINSTKTGNRIWEVQPRAKEWEKENPTRFVGFSVQY